MVELFPSILLITNDKHLKGKNNQRGSNMLRFLKSNKAKVSFNL